MLRLPMPARRVTVRVVRRAVSAARTGAREMPRATTAASTAGKSRKIRKGAKTASRNMIVPTSSVPSLASLLGTRDAPEEPAASADAATARAMAMTTFESTSATTSSASRWRIRRAVGHTNAA